MTTSEGYRYCQNFTLRVCGAAMNLSYLAPRLLRTARDEWQWIDSIPKVRQLPGEVERDRWLTRDEADRLIAVCPPHLSAIVRFALATGCRAREILSLE